MRFFNIKKVDFKLSYRVSVWLCLMVSRHVQSKVERIVRCAHIIGFSFLSLFPYPVHCIPIQFVRGIHVANAETGKRQHLRRFT